MIFHETRRNAVMVFSPKGALTAVSRKTAHAAVLWHRRSRAVASGVAVSLVLAGTLLWTSGSLTAQEQPTKLPDAADGTVKAQHGDWQVVCKAPPPGAKNEVCALVQSVTAEDRENVGLTVYF